MKQERTQPTRVKTENANEERSGVGHTPSTEQTGPSTLTDEDVSTLEAENCLPPRSEEAKGGDIGNERDQTASKGCRYPLEKASRSDDERRSWESVRLALSAAIKLEENENAGDGDLRSFLTAVAEAGRALIDIKTREPARAERHLEDMELMMSVVAGNLDGRWGVGEVNSAWTALKVVKQVHELYPKKTKNLLRYVLRFIAIIVKHSNQSKCVTTGSATKSVSLL